MATMLTLLDFRVRQRDFLLEISRAITAQPELSEVLNRVLTASVAKVSVGTFVTVESFKFSTLYQPSAGMLLAPVTTVLGTSMKDTTMSIARLSLNLKPLQDAGVQLPGGFIASLIKAHLEAFDTREI